MDAARRIKSKVSAAFKMRGLMLRPYVNNNNETLLKCPVVTLLPVVGMKLIKSTRLC